MSISRPLKLFRNIGSFISWVGAIIFGSLILFKGSETEFNLDYYSFLVTTNTKDIIFILIVFVILGLASLVKVENFKWHESVLVGTFAVACIGGLVYFKGDSIYSYIVQKKRYYFRTVPRDYFNYALVKASHLESEGKLSESRDIYRIVTDRFPDNPDISTIRSSINRLVNRQELSEKYHESYLNNIASKATYKSRLLCVLYAQYLNPESDVLRETIAKEQRQLKELVSSNKGLLRNSFEICDLLQKRSLKEHPYLFAERNFTGFNFVYSKMNDSIDCRQIEGAEFSDFEQAWFWIIWS